MTSTRDIFRPRNEPALTLYEAFQAEAAKRRQTAKVEDWVTRERHAVWVAARDYAQMHGLTVPTIEQVERAERYAMGSIDYGAKWAYGVAELMARKASTPSYLPLADRAWVEQNKGDPLAMKGGVV